MLQPGRQLAHFKIIRKLGEGGMGAVYLAEDTKLHRQVALKVLLPEISDRADRIERFQREARLAAQISHPHVMGIFDIGTAVDPDTSKELKYIVMEHVEGQSLSAYLSETQVDLAGVVKLAEKIASGLAAAHKLNIVHRDIKADNIIINAEGEPKILGFGLAKPASGLFEAGDHSLTQTVGSGELTRAGKILGTVSYMSPEQSRGEKIDTRSDIFSFGVLLYRMATGEFPFAGPTSVSTLAKILESRHESPRVKNENVPPELERIIDKCLQKDADDRYQDTRDLVVDLRNLRRLYDSGVSDTVSAEVERAARPVREKVFRLGWKQYSLIILAMILIFATISEILERNGSPRTRAVLAQGNSLAILGFENKTGDAALDWLETGLPEILLTDLAQSEAITIISRERIIDCFPEDKKTRHTFDECVEAAGSLGAVNLLSGAFYKLGDKIRIDARLQDVATGNVIAGEKVVGDDPFTLVDSLTAKIAASLNLAGSLKEDRNVATYTSSSPEAFQHYRRGVDKMYLELYDEAIDAFNQALAIDSTFALPYMRIGMCHIFQGKQQEGADYIAKARQYQSKLPARDQSLMEVYADIWLDQEFDDAFIKMASFVKRYPDDKEAHAIYSMLVNVFTGDTTKAFAHLDTALLIDPGYQLALSQYAALCEANEQYDRAIRYAETVQRLHPESPEPYLMLARIYASQDRYDDAIDELNSLMNRIGPHRDALARVSDLEIVKREFDEARAALEEFRRLIGDDGHQLFRYYTRRANLAVWQGRFRASMDDRFRAYREATGTGDSVLTFSALHAVASYYHRFEMHDSALFYVREANRWATAFNLINYPLRSVDWDHSRADEMEPLFKQSLEEMRRRLPSELWHVVDNLEGMFYAFGDNDTASLIRIYEDRAETEKNVNVYDGGRLLGTLLVLTGRFDEGKAAIEQNLKRVNDLTTAYHYLSSKYYIGVAEEGLGNTDEAIRNYEEVLRHWRDADVQIDIVKDARRRLADLTG
ncbi:MAG: protein kinase [Candidatus Zixiibacteriota bacterium]|nr:MAG: protein kinase [candidate division Zixibacteria bacterium]